MGARVTGKRVTRLAKVLVDVAWWFSILAAVLLVALVLAWPLMTSEGLDPTTHVDVSISNEAARRLVPWTAPDPATTSAVAVVELEDMEGRLELRLWQWWIVLLGGAAALPGLGAVLFGLHLIRTFLRDVRAGEVFTAANARRLSRLGWLLVAAGVLLPVVEFVYSLFLIRRADLSGVPVGVGVDGGVLQVVIAGILVLVLAGAWQYGVELQADHDLTV